ncbi:MAG TPA: RNA polymerase sigma factor [Blastocatellia bacterium]|nr:RNA polymerase sigma factor [Blastocatellia bacterium]
MAGKIRLDNLTDETLAVAAILGDLRSFDELALRYRAAAYRVARAVAGAELAEDAVQEALLLAFKALPSIEEPARFAAWLRAITRHAALRASRRARAERGRLLALDEALLEHSAAFARPFAPRQSAEAAWVRAGLEALAEDYRLVLQLRFEDEMPLGRIADFLGLPLSTVKWRLGRAKQLLREQLNPPVKEKGQKAWTKSRKSRS